MDHGHDARTALLFEAPQQAAATARAPSPRHHRHDEDGEHCDCDQHPEHVHLTCFVPQTGADPYPGHRRGAATRLITSSATAVHSGVDIRHGVSSACRYGILGNGGRRAATANADAERSTRWAERIGRPLPRPCWPLRRSFARTAGGAASTRAPGCCSTTPSGRATASSPRSTCSTGPRSRPPRPCSPWRPCRERAAPCARKKSRAASIASSATCSAGGRRSGSSSVRARPVEHLGRHAGRLHHLLRVSSTPLFIILVAALADREPGILDATVTRKDGRVATVRDSVAEACGWIAGHVNDDGLVWLEQSNIGPAAGLEGRTDLELR